jgi:hypothetical protein
MEFVRLIFSRAEQQNLRREFVKYRLDRRHVSFLTYTSMTFRERSHKYATKFITVTILNDNIQLVIDALIFHLHYQDILAAMAVAVVIVELIEWW